MKYDIENIWLGCCEQLKSILSDDIYDRWIAVIQPLTIENQQLKLAVANDFYKDWLEENYLPLIDKSLILIGHTDIKAVIEVDVAQFNEPKTEEQKAVDVPKNSKPSRRNGNKNKNNLNPAYTFESFVIGENNQFAHAAAMAAATSPSRTYNPLFIYGGVGLGKTHLMQAIGNHVLQQKSRTRVCYITCESFTNEYIDALQNNNVSVFRKKYRKVDLLLIDDIQFLDGKNRLQEEFFHTFNSLFESHKQIVLTSDRTPSEMSGLAPRLISRFEWGLVTELIKPDVETRTAILRKKAAFMQVDLDNTLIDYLAQRISSNIRSLEGALIRIATFSSLTQQPISLERVDQLLRDLIGKEESQPISIDLIQKTVADYFDIRLIDITSKKRTKDIAWPRQIAMHLSRKLTQQSFPSIGNKFERNHATVLYAHEQVNSRSKQDRQLEQTLALITEKIKQSKIS